MDNLIGKKLDGLYEVRELIGAGGMANVYKAVMVGQNGPVPAGTVVAVKVLRAEYMHDPDLVNRFKNESKAISLLHHPNIVKVYDVSVTDRLQYIVMEYVNGMTLRQYLNERGGRLTSRETVHFISQILQALDHAHRNGVVHRDVKPQNIMLLASGQLRMMDFGIARISRAENQLLAGKAMGSVHYISPEQARGEVTGPQSDIYSVGVMMYEMLSGRLPFDGDNPVSIAIQHFSAVPLPPRELNPEIPEALEQICLKAMACDRNKRYSTADEMLADLEAALEGMDLGPLVGLWLQSFVVQLTMTALNIVIFVIVYGRMIEIYMLTSLAPLPVATLANRELGGAGQNYLRSLFAVGFQGMLILVCVGIYAVLIQSIAVGGDPIGAIWGTIGYTVLLCYCLFKTGSIARSVLGAH